MLLDLITINSFLLYFYLRLLIIFKIRLYVISNNYIFYNLSTTIFYDFYFYNYIAIV